jgi:hypothetical protein
MNDARFRAGVGTRPMLREVPPESRVSRRPWKFFRSGGQAERLNCRDIRVGERTAYMEVGVPVLLSCRLAYWCELESLEAEVCPLVGASIADRAFPEARVACVSTCA